MYTGIPNPYDEYPLPRGFPFTSTSICERFHWIDAYGSNEIRHAYDVTLQWHCIPSHPQKEGVEPEESVRMLWIITFDLTGRHLAYLDIDPRIVNDPSPLFQIDGDLVLQFLCFSLKEDRAMHLTSRVVPEAPNPELRNPDYNYNVEIFELRTFDGHLVCEHGRRYVPRRVCRVCQQWIPQSGPPLCLGHIFM
ncbi:hypothetical protein BDZ94DRAFT_1305781 [Collybia nuda]|uniref:Uncharacterized protein n=1 Tax=Collybia nuda TaxID=64659 RepID=A0A9P5YFW9_9AGAR|nr:hypothetical protein BDZ94DRAFT_1305781 [Collybia nuda]